MPSVQRLLEDRLASAIRAAFPEAAQAPAIVMPAQDERFGDYQANGAMALAKRLGKKPRDVAAAIIAAADLAGIADPPEIAGPGFINLRLSAGWLAGQLAGMLDDARLGVPRPGERRTIVVDYSAPNLAKEMHVGHLRSTIIGDALVRVLDFLGHTVIRQNHVGDWGTQFGMLIAYMERLGAQRIDDHPKLRDSEEMYRAARALFDSDPGFRDAARQAVVRLQAGDKRCLDWWGFLRRSTLDHCQDIYHRLGVLLTPQDARGESYYRLHLSLVLNRLRSKGLLTESEGAQCVFLEDEKAKPLFVNKEGEPLPFIVQKSDEGFLYTTTDLAAIRYRVGHLKADRILYVVDARQSLHFAMLFECAKQAGFAPPSVALHHVAFGMMMGSDNRPFKTREGGTVKLMDLLDEAERRALELVTQKNDHDVAAERAEALSADEKKVVARVVGIGALKYADLSQNRTKDYVFSWDRMLALDGNTAPYMQYACARINSIARRGGLDLAALMRGPASGEGFMLAEPAERRLALALLQFAETIETVADDCVPHVLCGYLYRLAGAFMGFYETCPVLKADEPLRTSRLALCGLTAKVIAKGLDLLGIATAERM